MFLSSESFFTYHCDLHLLSVINLKGALFSFYSHYPFVIRMSYFLSPPPFLFLFNFVSLFHKKAVNQNAKTGAKLNCHSIFISAEGAGKCVWTWDCVCACLHHHQCTFVIRARVCVCVRYRLCFFVGQISVDISSYDAFRRISYFCHGFAYYRNHGDRKIIFRKGQSLKKMCTYVLPKLNFRM